MANQLSSTQPATVMLPAISLAALDATMAALQADPVTVSEITAKDIIVVSDTVRHLRVDEYIIEAKLYAGRDDEVGWDLFDWEFRLLNGVTNEPITGYFVIGRDGPLYMSKEEAEAWLTGEESQYLDWATGRGCYRTFFRL